MKAKLAKWGNSLAVRIPKHVAESAQLRKGDHLELVVSRPGAVEIRSLRPKLTLVQLVRGITPENCHGETDWGRARGRELW
jgi:antitoxin MazE